MTTISFVAQLAIVSKQPPKLLLGWLHKTVQFLARALEVLLALCCTLHPSSNSTKKSQVGLNLVIWGEGGTQQILCTLSTVQKKCYQDMP
jgi:hypothetical protein